HELGAVSGGITKNANRGSFPASYPYLRVANVYTNHLVLEEMLQIGVTPAEFARTKLECGDVLFVEGNGSIDQIGRVALWGDEISNCIHQNHIIKWRSSGKVQPRFALYAMMSPDGRERLMEQAVSSAGLHSL